MKLLAAILLGGAVLAAAPANAQNRDNNMSRPEAQNTPHETQDVVPQKASHRPSHRRVAYQRNYKTDDEERQQTQELNRQYRGVPSSDAR
jgi:PAB1-binding protein PBP1